MKTHVIDGVTYVEVDRKAEVGERVIDKSDGEICEVLGLKQDDHYRYGVKIRHNGVWIGDSEYYVLAEIDEPCCVDESQSSPAVIDMLANLARRVTSLEAQLSDSQKNIEKLAIELAEAYQRGPGWAEIGALNEEIQAINKRTQVLDAINKYYAEGQR